MIEFRCPDCQTLLRAGPHLAGTLVGCGRCKRHVQVPDSRISSHVPDVVPDVIPDVIAEEPFAFSHDEPPLIRPGGAIGGRGRYAPCPFCRCPGHADRVSYTFWGGFLGPMMFSHVRCRHCRRCYNGSTGGDNSTAIALYVGISLALGLMFLICAGLARMR